MDLVSSRVTALAWKAGRLRKGSEVQVLIDPPYGREKSEWVLWFFAKELALNRAEVRFLPLPPHRGCRLKVN